MILYYAMGGGLGHLVRARAVLHTLGLESRAAIVTASAHAADPRVVGRVPVFRAPSAGERPASDYRDWLTSLLTETAPEEIFVDTFPAGLLGEWNALADLPVVRGARRTYVGRLLRWSEYTTTLHVPPRLSFARGLFVEDLHPDHDAAMRSCCDDVRSLVLRDPPPDPTADVANDAALANVLRMLPQRFWLVVHSGPQDEVVELVAYARDRQRYERNEDPLLLACPLGVIDPLSDLLGATPIDVYPATALCHRAARVITACGFNSMRQMWPIRERHAYLPFQRRFDDQFARAERRRQTP